MAKSVTIEIDSEEGRLDVTSGALFLGEQATISLTGYTPGTGHTLRLTVFGKDGVTPLADNHTTASVLDLRADILRKQFGGDRVCEGNPPSWKWTREDHGTRSFTASVIELDASGNVAGGVIAAGMVAIAWAPYVFDAASGAPATMKGENGDPGSVVSVSATGSATDEVQYITIDGVEKKLAGGGGVRDYDDLTGRPQIAGTTLTGNKSLADLGIMPSSVTHLSGDIATGEKGAANGVATLGSDGKLASAQMPTVTVPTKTSDLTNDGADGTNAFVATNDSRMTNARQPTAHASTHAKNGTDEISPEDIGAVEANTAITGATKCKVSYDSKGLVTGGADLAANDIPSLDASKITSGTFADARIESAATWNAKYAKPDAGIPKSDLASAVQTSLGLADTAVQPESGKGLSSNDYTTAEKNKLSGIAAGAEVNVQSDWSVTDTNDDAYIKNKPAALEYDTEPTQDSTKHVKSGGIWSWVKGLLPDWLTPTYTEPATVASVSAKITNPSGGSAGNVLKKTASGVEWAAESGGTITDVKVNEESVVSEGVANIPYAGTSTAGVISISDIKETKVNNATQADSATTAGSASSADTATSAGMADYASQLNNALTLTPIDASGTAGDDVEFDGSEGKSLNVVTAHQDISGKISNPSGGSVGNVLKKTASGVEWAAESGGGLTGHTLTVNFVKSGGSTTSTLIVVFADGHVESGATRDLSMNPWGVTYESSGLVFNNVVSYYSGELHGKVFNASDDDGPAYNTTAISADTTVTHWTGCLLRGTLVTLADGTQKPIEDVSYADELLVWDFDSGRLSSARPAWIKRAETTDYSFRNRYSDGRELLTTGRSATGWGHRHFDADRSEFRYTPTTVGDRVATLGGTALHVSCERVEGPCEFYNVITERHFNLYANGILTSCSLNNFRPVSDMRYAPEPHADAIRWEDFSRVNVELNVREDTLRRYYDALRIGEFPSSRLDEIKAYVAKLVRNSYEYEAIALPWPDPE